MSDQDAAYLSRTLELMTHLHPKLYNSPASPGVMRLDFDSGLFLRRGPTAGHWLLEGEPGLTRQRRPSASGTCVLPWPHTTSIPPSPFHRG